MFPRPSVRNHHHARKTHGARQLGRRCAAILAATATLACSLIVPGSAVADDRATDPYGNHIVANDVNPSSVSTDLFDYWITSQDANDNIDVSNQKNLGINNGHALKFTTKGIGGTDGSYINVWTGDPLYATQKTAQDKQTTYYSHYGGPWSDEWKKYWPKDYPDWTKPLGIVNRTLTDGYPTLAKANKPDPDTATTGAESLAYLFDPRNTEASEYKKAYKDVTGLLQLEDGYYTYDSQQNFASLDTSSGQNTIKLYDTPAVDTPSGVHDRQSGQFFPLNTADQVFTTDANGGLKSKVKSNDTLTGGKSLNHYFGLHSQAYFIQPEGGTVTGEPMTFDFSGDDDVWVFIDGVLVGDVSGIHDRLKLSIDFQSGKVTVANGANYESWIQQKANKFESTTTTIRQAFADAYGEDSDAYQKIKFNGDTFADGSSHTLDFFYLERGGNNSSLKLKFNLATVPDNNLVKVDQQGNRVPGAKFRLYAAKEDYSYTDSDLLSEGVTDDNGSYVFKDLDTDSPLNFSSLARDGDGITHYVLKEVSAPAGYRVSPEVRLRYEEGATGNGLLLCNEKKGKWDSGAWSVPRETLTVEKGAKVYKAAKYGDNTPIDLDQGGRAFAVILQRDKTSESSLGTDKWYAVTGNALSGWQLSKDPVGTMAQLVQIAQSDAAGTTNFMHFLTKNSEGKYSVTVDNMPGDIFTYYYMMKPEDRYNALYTVAVYYTTAETTEDISKDNTVRLASSDGSTYGDQFIRQHGVQLILTDVRNAPIVQKVDEDGNPVEGATFGIYAENQTDKAADGTVTLKSDAEPIQTCETKNTDYPYPMDGSCMFGKKASGVTFGNGTYYIKEIKAPAGYTINNTLAKVLINDKGIYADAGSEDDGISTVTHIGMMNQSMYQFASNRDINRTLSDLTIAQKQCSTEACVTNEQWADSGKSVKVSWKTKKSLDGAHDVSGYWLTDETNMTDNGFVNTTGWTTVGITQTDDKDIPQELRNGKGIKFQLQDADLAHLFTGAAIVRVTDQRNDSLAITKKASVAEGYTGPTKTDSSGNTVSALDDQQFPFKVVLKASSKAALKQDGTTFYYHGSITNSGTERDTGTAVTMKLENIKADGAGNVSGELRQCTAKVTDETDATDEKRCAKTATITLRNRETLHITNITDDVQYTVSEPTDDAMVPMPEGFKQIGATGATGTIARANGTNESVFSNQYGGMTVNLPASDFATVRKTLNGTTWNDSFAFRFRLEAENGAPMPSCADGVAANKCSVHVDSASGDTVMDKVLDTTTGQMVSGADTSRDMTFGDITYNKPGTYTYRVTEYTPNTTDKDLYQQYFSYSNAVYEVTVTMAVKDGKLAVTGTTIKQIRDDAGFAMSGTATGVEGRPAEFVNTYSTNPRYVSFKAHKTYTENGYPYQAGMFGAKLQPVANAMTASISLDDTVNMAEVLASSGAEQCKGTVTSCAPMPTQSGSPLASADASFGADHTGTFPSIAFMANTANRTYFYAISENKHTATGSSSQASDAADPVKYDSTVYVAAVTVTSREEDGKTVVDAQTTYYRAPAGTSVSGLATATLTKVGTAESDSTPVDFTNTYKATPATATPKVKKTLTGHVWDAKYAFEFTLQAADKATEAAINAGDVDCSTNTGCLSGGKTLQVTVKSSNTGTAASSDTSITGSFGTLQFKRVGTYVFTVKETAGNLNYIDYDTHTATVTFTVSDLDANSKHCGTLSVVMRYDNAEAASAADRGITDAAAFTNAYHARLAYTGFPVRKILMNKNAGTTRNLRDGEFTFSIEGHDEASRQRISGGSLVDDREFGNNATTDATESHGESNQGRATTVMRGKLAGSIGEDGTEHGLVFNESDAGKTYRFVITELPQHTIDGETNTTPDNVEGNPINSGANAGDVRIDGVWCKKRQYMAEVKVYDNGDGTMYTVTKALKKDGNDSDFRDYSSSNPTVTAGMFNGVRKNDVLLDSTFSYANTYETLSPVTVAGSSPLYKQLTGRSWGAGTAFTFTAKKCNYNPVTTANTLNFTVDGGTIGCSTDSTILGILPAPSNGFTVSVSGGSSLIDGTYGSVVFGSFTFSKIGTYVYQVTEVAGNDPDIEYDTRTRYIRFVVTEDQKKGALAVRASTPGYKTFDGAAFVNKAKVNDLPFTGGETMRGVLIAGILIAGLAVVSYAAYRKYGDSSRRRGTRLV